MRIAIAGAGIAGLAGALSLARPGRAVTVCERRTGFGETGAGIQLSPNATRVLHGLGLGSGLARIAVEPEAVVIRSLRGGREIGRVQLGEAARARYGSPFLTVARADLHTLLLDAVRSRHEVRLRIGRGVAGLRATAAGIELDTEAAGGSRETLAADLLVGADGLWSRVRRELGDLRTPRLAGYAAYRTTLPRRAVADGDGPTLVGLWLGARSHVVHYPIGGGRLNVVVVAARRDDVAERDHTGWSTPVERGIVQRLLAGAHDDVQRLVATASDWSAWALHDLPAGSLGSGRVALIGDAAHPVLPYLAQGGSLAIEDAAHLASLLGDVLAEIPAVVGAYARARTARVRRVQAEARRNGRVYHAGGPIAFARDLVMSRLGPDRMLARYDWLYGWTVPGDPANASPVA